MGNRRIGNRRIEAVLDNLLSQTSNTNGVNNSAFVLRDPDRLYLEEHFAQTPGINGDLANTSEATRVPRNRNFEVLGVNATSDDVTLDGATGMIKMETDGSNQDAISIFPHQDTAQSKWALAGMWGSENQVDFECTIRTGSNIGDTKIIAGLKLTEDSGNNYTLSTDSDQVMFYYATDDTEGALTTNANLHCVVSSAGTDYVTDLGIVVAVDTNYRLGISIDSNRQPSAFVNGVQYSLTHDSTAGGVTTGAGTAKGPALANDKDLFPNVVIEALAAAARHLYLGYIKCSRIMFE